VRKRTFLEAEALIEANHFFVGVFLSSTAGCKEGLI